MHTRRAITLVLPGDRLPTCATVPKQATAPPYKQASARNHSDDQEAALQVRKTPHIKED